MTRKERNKLLRLRLGAPLLCLLMLGGIQIERSRRLSPVDVEPYHARAKQAVENVRYTIGLWTGADVPVPEAAQQLLRPNALLSRVYVDNDPSRRASEEVSLLIVQCRDPRDMQGHYPPNCYPAHGAQKTGERNLQITIPGTATAEPLVLNCTEYVFASNEGARQTSTVVLNTLILPGKGTMPDMKSVYAASEDYQRRLFGAAQVQIVVPDVVSPQRRQKIYEQFFTSSADTLRTLIGANLQAKTEK